jgi:hypothetical protein
MKRLIATLAVVIAASASAQETRMVKAVGQGRTPTEANADLHRKAIEEVSGIVVTSNLEANKKRLTKDEIGNYSAGYIEKYVITNVVQDNNGYTVWGDVWVRPSKMADQKLNAGKDQQSLSGGVIGTQYQSLLRERSSADKFVSQIVNDYPKRAFIIEQSQPTVFIDKDRDAVITVPFIISWNPKYLIALKEAMTVIAVDKRTDTAVTVISREKDSIFAAVNTFYFNDRTLALTISSRLSNTPWIVATIYDENNKVLDKQCRYYEETFASERGIKGFEISGNKRVAYNLEIKVEAGSKLASKILLANKIELSTILTGEGCSN